MCQVRVYGLYPGSFLQPEPLNTMRDVIPPAPEDMILGLGMLDNQSCWLIGWIRWFWVTPTGSDIFDGSVGTKCSNHLHIHLSSSSIRRTATSTRSKNPWTGHQSITELNHWNTCPVPYQDGTKTGNLLTKMVSSQQRYKGERERDRGEVSKNSSTLPWWWWWCV